AHHGVRGGRGDPAFDPNGKALCFTASTNSGPSEAGIDLSSLDRGTNSGVYVVVLSRNGASPIPPQSDDENKKKDDDAKKDDSKNGEAEKGADKDAVDKDQPGSKDDKKDKDKNKKKDAEKLKPTVIDLAGIGHRNLS